MYKSYACTWYYQKYIQHIKINFLVDIIDIIDGSDY